MRWTAPRRWNYPHLIRHGLRRATFPYEGKATGCAAPLGSPFRGAVTEGDGEVVANLLQSLRLGVLPSHLP